MPNQIRDLHRQDLDEQHGLVVDLHVDIPLKALRGTKEGLVRGNVYRSKAAVDSEQGQPVLVTYAPYGKDIPYENFQKKSFSELPEEQKSKWSAWEVPEPTYWTKHGYVLLRVDERGFGQSPGFADTMSPQTASDFAQVIEWAATQPFCNGKVGLLGISYYGGSQWRVAALKPRGLTCMVPWEGMSDYYRDRVRHGGILSNKFIDFWWYRQVATNLYGLPGRAARNWGPDTIEGDLPEEEIKQNRVAQPEDTAVYKYLDEPYYASRDYNMADIDVPCLSVANWGGILLHLRGNVEGYMGVGCKQKWLRFITGRHDIPFFLPEFVALQKSFLDAFLLDDDRDGWKAGKVAPVNVCLRKGNPGYNVTEAERTFAFRDEPAWPLPSTVYTKYHLSADGQMGPDVKAKDDTSVTWQALTKDSMVEFKTTPATEETEITGHLMARLTVGLTASASAEHKEPKDIDLFVTLRHYDAHGQQIFYTGTAGDPVPVCKGWLRCSLRKANESHPLHRELVPRREYRRDDVEYLQPGAKYTVDVEIWPTNVVLSKGSVLGFEISGSDTQGTGIFEHNHPSDRSPETFAGDNHLYFGAQHDNYLVLPIIPHDASKELAKNPFSVGDGSAKTYTSSNSTLD